MKDKHLPKKNVKFNRKKHKMAKWMTNGILKSINNKVKLYEKTCENGCRWKCSIYNFKKINILKNTLRSSINEAKRLYFRRTFAL